MRSALYPAILVSLLWVVHVLALIFDFDISSLGIYPKRISGLQGIVFAPLIHSGFTHLISNTFPLLILGTILFYFYNKLGLAVTILAWLFSGLWVWVFATGSYHIGASGIIYAWASFLFTSGIIRGHPQLVAISLLVAFVYGSIIWGIFPTHERISWEGHLMGMVAGIVLAIYFRKEGSNQKPYSWEIENEDEDEVLDENNPPYWMKGGEANSENDPNARP